ncbi:transcriptional regulator FtrA [Thioclava sp. 'Guangxiensis']|uniref:transcriptional regulator FtrA n=1 Tax=Thioclava sp. 'Guangxiensis' TaxID=3149044 RepID=UPI003877D6A0
MTTPDNILPFISLRPIPNNLVVALIYDGLCTFEFGVTAEIFGLPRPEMGPDWYRFRTAAVEPGPLRAHGGLMVSTDGGLELLDDAGLIVIPGWKGVNTPASPELVAALIAAHARGARIATICSGAYILAQTGLLDGHSATTHWRYAEDFAARFPQVTMRADNLYTDDAPLYTSAGSAAGLDLGLHIVRQDFGPEAANSVARRLVIASHRDGGQNQFLPRPVPRATEADKIAPLLDRLRQNLRHTPTISALAKSCAMSQRTFLRRFEEATGTTPIRFLIEERLQLAAHLLERPEAGMEEIAAQCGFASSALLRHHFRKRYGLPPAAWRQRFGQAQGS